ncbi:MAG TPA: 1-deoxy-D-xylulose-5-phosphate synthase [Candidatus Paceibacterota bacterium]|nr:1-deoxy-D-xylulose-5-phosphate synthase [Candidatus Paceibacterota bacterium]
MIDSLNSPQDLASFSTEEMSALAGEIRAFLIEKVTKSGGHLGPNLGVVELTLAIHRVFQSPKDVILFDTGHQSYVHKILTGRAAGFDLLRQRGGLAGYPSRAESAHDVIENSHASTSLSWGDGISRGFALQGRNDRSVVVVVGDGALTGGMAWEALNNIATSKDQRLVIVVNDNERSYSPTIGGLASQGMFEDLGLKYIGPIDGHDIAAMESALEKAKHFGAPVIVHALTKKGQGYSPAIADEAEKFHAIGILDPETGQPLAKSSISWTNVFSKELAEIGQERKEIVAITAAMLGPTGLDEFQRRFPERTVDVGIAEQHALTSAAGLAFTGMHPVVALYSTFLNRAFDQLLLDVSLHHAGVTLVLDRAGITGDDGPSHHGMWDLALTGIIPTLQVAAPRDGTRLKESLREALNVNDAPTLIRFPKGALPQDIGTIERVDGIDFLYRSESDDVLLVSVGAFAHLSLEVAAQAQREGVGVTVIDPRWVKPLPLSLLDIAQKYSRVVVIEDGIRHGGIASSLSEMFRDAQSAIPIHSIGVPLEFIEHSKRAEILHDLGITVQDISRSILEWHSYPSGNNFFKAEMQSQEHESEIRKPIR